MVPEYEERNSLYRPNELAEHIEVMLFVMVLL